MDYIFNKSVASLFDAFHAGFHKVCGGKVLLLFQPNELQAMVIGNTNYDWKELEKVRKIPAFTCQCRKGRIWLAVEKLAHLYAVALRMYNSLVSLVDTPAPPTHSALFDSTGEVLETMR